MGAVYCDVSLPVCLPASISTELYIQFLPILLLMLITNVHSSLFLWRRCDGLGTSSFMDDVMFAHNSQ